MVKILTVVFGVSIATFPANAQDVAAARAFYTEAILKVAECATVFPIHSIVQATEGKSMSREQQKQLEHFLTKGKLSRLSLGADPQLNKECSEIVTGLIFEQTKDYARQLKTPIHSEIANNRAICASQYKYAETVQTLVQDSDIIESKTAADALIDSGQISPNSADSKNLDQTQICTNLVKGSAFAIFSQAAFGKFNPENDIVDSINQAANVATEVIPVTQTSGTRVNR